MRALRALLGDRRRSQRGSVLSGVLILTMFISILSAALMTALSTNFLLSRNQLTRASNEATVNSATELALNQLQTSAVSAGCPALSAVSLNARRAAPSYTSCWPINKEGVYTPAAPASSQFNVDGTNSVVGSQSYYDLASSGGRLYHFRYGQSQPLWTDQLQGRTSGPPVTFADPNGGSNRLLTFVPLSLQGLPPVGCLIGGCVAMVRSAAGSAPDGHCYMPTTGVVSSRVALGISSPTVAFIGDSTGDLFAYRTSPLLGLCLPVDVISGPSQAIVAGPFVFRGSGNGNNRSDEIYVVTTSAIRHYTFSRNNLSQSGSLNLPASNAIGAAIEGTTLPARIAISFSSGRVVVDTIRSDFGLQSGPSAVLPSTLAADPHWCNCPGNTDRIGVTGTNGAFYLLDASLTRLGTLAAGGPSITTSPGTDGLGDWFFGAADGRIHELQQLGAQMVEVTSFGALAGSIGSSVDVGACAPWICLYAGTQNGRAYLIPLDSRSIVISTCISNTSNACTGAKPRLWVKAEIGSAANSRLIHLQGWSYYSP